MELVRKLMNEGVCAIDFTKVSGEERHMICTTLFGEVAKTSKNFIIPNRNTRKKNPNIQVVWDLEEDAFRSIRLDSIKHYELLTTTIHDYLN